MPLLLEQWLLLRTIPAAAAAAAAAVAPGTLHAPQLWQLPCELQRCPQHILLVLLLTILLPPQLLEQ
jgi:hypothetical protein